MTNIHHFLLYGKSLLKKTLVFLFIIFSSVIVYSTELNQQESLYLILKAGINTDDIKLSLEEELQSILIVYDAFEEQKFEGTDLSGLPLRNSRKNSFYRSLVGSIGAIKTNNSIKYHDSYKPDRKWLSDEYEWMRKHPLPIVTPKIPRNEYWTKTRLKYYLTRHAIAWNIDPRIYFGLVEAESAWTYNAKSHLRYDPALGPTQIRCNTARGLGYKNRCYYLRVNPEYGIFYSAKYLHQMDVMFDGDLYKSLAAYLVGPGRVNRILNGYEPLPVWLRDAINLYVSKIHKYAERS